MSAHKCSAKDKMIGMNAVACETPAAMLFAESQDNPRPLCWECGLRAMRVAADVRGLVLFVSANPYDGEMIAAVAGDPPPSGPVEHPTMFKPPV